MYVQEYRCGSVYEVHLGEDNDLMIVLDKQNNLDIGLMQEYYKEYDDNISHIVLTSEELVQISIFIEEL